MESSFFFRGSCEMWEQKINFIFRSRNSMSRTVPLVCTFFLCLTWKWMLVFASPEDKVISLVQRLDQEGVSVTLYNSHILQPIFKQPSNVYWLSFGLVFRDQVSMHKLGRASAGIHSTSRTGNAVFSPCIGWPNCAFRPFSGTSLGKFS